MAQEISEQIKTDRDNQLKELNEKLKTNEELVGRACLENIKAVNGYK
jgi:hypothetical protein